MDATRRVLVVDDDAVVGQSINRVLAGRGFLVTEAASGKDALEELERRPYDLVFTDLRMPGMCGLDMAARLKKSHPDLSVVVVTGYGTEASETLARELGVAGYLRKPLPPQTIIDQAERVLRERDETRAAIRRSALALISPAAAATAAPVEVAAAAEPTTLEEPANVAKNVALFFAAPFIGLAYIVAAPFVGFWAIGRYAFRSIAGRR